MQQLLTFLLFTLIAAAFGQRLPWLPFHWAGGTLAGRPFGKVASPVPVSLNNLPRKLNMQPDLGAVTIKTSSWSEYYYVGGRCPQGAGYFGKAQLPSGLVPADNRRKFGEFYAEEHVWGIIGNAYFLHSTVIINYEKPRFWRAVIGG